MPHAAAKLCFYDFDKNSFLSDYFAQPSGQIKYIREYLHHLGASSVIEEPHYFDRDYLAEFSAFYGISATGYINVCRRIHVFAGQRVTRKKIESALSGTKSLVGKLQKQYLGFIVIRPIEGAPLGKTVLRWYPEHTPSFPRVVNPSRVYKVHIAGLPLEVHGLAWQQQDAGVAACATIAVWSMLHSSAFDDFHAIPTTTDITKAAHKTASLGARMFPAAKGLTIEQICESIKECGFSPLILGGDQVGGFSPFRFSASVASFIRSGYPVLLLGSLENGGGHAICAVGFREKATVPSAQTVTLSDAAVAHFYIHDDNLGPNVRFEISTNSGGVAAIAPSAPNSATEKELFNQYGGFVPQYMVVAVHNDLRTDADDLLHTGLETASAFRQILFHVGLQPLLSMSTRFVKLSDYFSKELLASSPQILARVRLALYEQVPPMCLHLGIIRIANDSLPVIDILVDTTDSQHRVFAHVVYLPLFGAVLQKTAVLLESNFGVRIDAF